MIGLGLIWRGKTLWWRHLREIDETNQKRKEEKVGPFSPLDLLKKYWIFIGFGKLYFNGIRKGLF